MGTYYICVCSGCTKRPLQSWRQERKTESCARHEKEVLWTEFPVLHFWSSESNASERDCTTTWRQRCTEHNNTHLVILIYPHCEPQIGAEGPAAVSDPGKALFFSEEFAKTVNKDPNLISRIHKLVDAVLEEKEVLCQLSCWTFFCFTWSTSHKYNPNLLNVYVCTYTLAIKFAPLWSIFPSCC